MVRIVFCDDEKIIRDKYVDYLEKVQNLYGVEIKVTVFSQPDSLIANIDDWINSTDILLLDIEMGDYNGIKVAEEARKNGYNGEIVFLTVSKTYVFDSFNVNPMQYIIKAKDDYETFVDKFSKILDILGESYMKMFGFSVAGNAFFVPLRSIISFEIKKRIIIMDYIDQNGKYKTVEFYMTLSTVEEKTSMMKFIKVHRSFLVNPAYINAFKSKEVLMVNGKYIPLSRSYVGDAKHKFCEYLELKGMVIE